MRICALLNARAGQSSAIDALRGRLLAKGWTVCEPHSADDFTAAIRRAADEGFDRIVLAGGDGTLHIAVNTLPADCRIPLAVVPIGTGNDWARTLAVPLDTDEAMLVAVTGRVREFDIIGVTGDTTRRLLNAATGGFAGQVAENLTKDRKEAWGPLAYLREASAVAIDPPRWSVTVRFDDGTPRTFEVINVVVANGRTAGGGILVAPMANAEDGRLDVLLVKASNVFDRTVVTARILAGEYDRDKMVLHRRVRRFELTAEPAMPFSFDGEEGRGECLQFAVQSRAVRFVVGPTYRPRGDRHAGLLGLLFGFCGGVLRLFRPTLSRHRGLVTMFLACLMAFTGLAVYRDDLRPWDDRVMLHMREFATPLMTNLMVALTRLGDTLSVTFIATAAVLGFAFVRRYLDAAMLALVMIGAPSTSRILKEIFAVARPDLFPPVLPVDGYSFPSGHAVAAAALYGTLTAIWLRPPSRRRWLAALAVLLIACGIMLSRVYLGAHRPTEVIAGACVGGAWTLAGLWLRGRFRRPAIVTARS